MRHTRKLNFLARNRSRHDSLLIRSFISLAEQATPRARFARIFQQAKNRLFLSPQRQSFKREISLPHVSVSKGLGGYVSVEVQAFDPQYAQTLAKAIRAVKK
jgi:hypothetical protein